jgi:hypothetical protein
MTNWKALAQARDLGIPAADLDRIVAPLEALEETFRPLAASLMPEQEPCTIFRADEDVE